MDLKLAAAGRIWLIVLLYVKITNHVITTTNSKSININYLHLILHKIPTFHKTPT